jgi:hypothetical protein
LNPLEIRLDRWRRTNGKSSKRIQTGEPIPENQLFVLADGAESRAYEMKDRPAVQAEELGET